MKFIKLSTIQGAIPMLFFILAFGLQQAKSAVIIVTSSNDSGTGSLREAISTANGSSGADEIQFDASVTTITLASSLSITDDLTITGSSTKVTIDGAGTNTVFTMPNLGDNPTIILRNLIIQNGRTGGNGGGILMNTIGILTLENCHFTGNVAGFNGGAIHAQNADVNATACSFQGNSVTGTFGFGGAIYSGATLSITNCTFFDNAATSSGGAVYAELTLTVVNSTFYQNRANSDNSGFAQGGGIYSDITCTLKNNIIYGNTNGGTNDDVNGTATGDANLIGVCSGCNAGVVDFTSDPNLSAAQTCNDLVYFQPQAPSDAIDNGINDSDIPSTDICGNARVAGSINLGNIEESMALPVELLDFEAKRIDDHKVLLTWITATEKNNTGFEIEMSEDGQHFQKVAFVAGAGTSTAIKRYQWMVDHTKSAYYRLKQIDFDGSFAYSNVRFSKGFTQHPKLFLYTNLSQGSIHFAITNYDALIHVRVLDLQGKAILALSGTQETINQKLNQALSGWPSNTYVFRILTKNKVWTKKVLINR